MRCEQCVREDPNLDSYMCHFICQYPNYSNGEALGRRIPFYQPRQHSSMQPLSPSGRLVSLSRHVRPSELTGVLFLSLPEKNAAHRHQDEDSWRFQFSRRKRSEDAILDCRQSEDRVIWRPELYPLHSPDSLPPPVIQTTV